MRFLDWVASSLAIASIVTGGDGILLVQARNDGVDIALGLRECDAWFGVADDGEVVSFAVVSDISLPVGKGAEDFRNDVHWIDPEQDLGSSVAEVVLDAVPRQNAVGRECL